MHPVPWIRDLPAEIDSLERGELEHSRPGSFTITDLLDGQAFCRVRGLANFWQAQAESEFVRSVIDMVAGTHIQRNEPLVFVLVGTPTELSVYLSSGEQMGTRSLLQGIFPNIDLIPVREIAPTTLRRVFKEQGIITGIPGRASFNGENASVPGPPAGGQGAGSIPADTQGSARLERVIRGMSGSYWCYVVHAHPRKRDEVLRERLTIIDKLTQVTALLRHQRQSSEQINPLETTTRSGEVTNYRAQYLIRLLERQLERFDEALAHGQWMARVFFGAEQPAGLQRLASLLVGTLAGKDSRPEPVRTHLCQSYGAANLDDFVTPLSSEEVASLIQLPREEVPGYAISDFVRFDVDMRQPRSTSSNPILQLGRIQQYGRDSGEAYAIPLNDLAKHAVIVGVTGSGKTTTVMNILEQLVDASTPFLIIEPAKTEYRALRRAFAGQADVRIYTLGNETVAPFRLNPFEFETDDVPGRASVVNHIDFLKAVFNAAFILYAPMPYVLETALHEIYEDKGWDLATGLNPRMPKWEDRHLYPIFPTLTDLYYKIDAVVERLGYDTEIERNVKGGLKARIGAMRIGSKGLMLDTARGIPMSQLLAHPTILEMENIGGDDEKTFLMGMILAKLYEYRRMQTLNPASAPNGSLQHLLVFEEAHRLLKHTETQVDTESSNMRAQAVEVFSNMLSEVRAYGQGVLVAEQIPAKLASDVLKNTNLKIVHRLIARDDRESVGATMNLNNEQIAHLGILTPGQASVFAEGADHAYLVQMHNAKARLSPLTDDLLKTQSPTYISVRESLGIRNLKDYGLRLSDFGGPDAALYQAAARVLDSAASDRLWARLLLCTVLNRPALPQILGAMRHLIERTLPSLANQREMALRMILVRGSFETLYRRGLTFGWNYPLIEEMRLHLTRGLIILLQTGDLAHGNADLDRFARKYEQYMHREQGPFVGCTACRAICRYRLDVRESLLPADVGWIKSDLSDASYKTEADRYAALAKTARGIAETWLGITTTDTDDVGYCAALHAAAHLGLSDYEQAIFGTRLSAELLK